MKKITIIGLVLMLTLSFVACSPSKPNDVTNKETNKEANKEDVKKMDESENKQDNESKETEKESNSTDKVTPKVVVENFSKQLEFDETPTKAMCLDLTTAEMMIALGLEDNVGYARLGHFKLEQLLPENQEKASKMAFPEEIAKGVPTIENIIKLSPDLLIANSYYFNAEPFGKYEDYEKNKIKIYVPEGTYAKNISISTIYDDIENLSEIFGVTEAGDSLIKSFKERVDNVKAKVADKPKVKVLSIGGIGEQIFVAGGSGLENEMITLAGGENVFEEITDQFPKVGIENIIEKNPDVIYVHAFGDDPTGQKKIDFLKSQKELSDINAIKNDRIIVYKLIAIFPGVQCFDTLESMAEEFHK